MFNGDLDVVRRLGELDATSRSLLLDFIGQARRDAPDARRQDESRPGTPEDGADGSSRPKLRH